MYVFCVYVVDRICEWRYYYFNEYIHLIMGKYYVAAQFISITDDLFFDKNVFHFNSKRFIDPSDKWYSTLSFSLDPRHQYYQYRTHCWPGRHK